MPGDLGILVRTFDAEFTGQPNALTQPIPKLTHSAGELLPSDSAAKPGRIAA